MLQERQICNLAIPKGISKPKLNKKELNQLTLGVSVGCGPSSRRVATFLGVRTKQRMNGIGRSSRIALTPKVT